MRVSKEYAESIRQQLTSRQIDRTGQRNGRLVFLYPTKERVAGGPIKWIARCDCGSLTLCVPSKVLAMSCGCLRVEKSVPAASAAKRKLTEMEIESIKRTLMTAKDCAKVFSVSLTTIYNIRAESRRNKKAAVG